MPRYILHLAFKGSQYKGWQWQKGQSTIQGTIEETLSKILGRPTQIHGCGRTDAGVHASQYFAHCDLSIADIEEFKFILNKNLPPDISLLELLETRAKFNAQTQVISRKYRYFLHFTNDPLLHDLSTFIQFKPDYDLMNEALGLIKGQHDFRHFTLTPDRQINTVCEIQSCKLFRDERRKQICIEFEADHFLKAMVRLLVSEILDVGAENRTLSQMKNRLDLNEPKHPYTKPAFPQGLYLSGLSYTDFTRPRLASEPFTV